NDGGFDDIRQQWLALRNRNADLAETFDPVRVVHSLLEKEADRQAAVVRGLVDAGEEVHVAFGGVPVSEVSFGGANVHYLPPVRSADAFFSRLVSGTEEPIDNAWWARRTQMLLDLHATVAPQLIVTEHFPFGRRKFARELEPMFEAARAGGVKAIACSVRDVVVAPDDAKRRCGMIEIARRWFDCIAVHGDPRVLRLEDSLAESRVLEDLIEYTGYIAPSPLSRPTSPELAGNVIVAAGGGAVGVALFEAALAARAIGLLADRTWRFLVGPNFDPAVAEAMRRAAPENVVIEATRGDYRALLAAATVSISQAGYNTMLDLAVTRCPAVVVPFSAGGESEQALRAEKFAEFGLVHVVDEGDCSAARLSRAVNAALCGHRDLTRTLDLDGVAQSVALLRRLGGGA
ncbi:MAG: glycosyltransferase, partial [Pseudomonadota bacterium]